MNCYGLPAHSHHGDFTSYHDDFGQPNGHETLSLQRADGPPTASTSAAWAEERNAADTLEHNIAAARACRDGPRLTTTWSLASDVQLSLQSGHVRALAHQGTLPKASRADTLIPATNGMSKMGKDGGKVTLVAVSGWFACIIMCLTSTDRRLLCLMFQYHKTGDIIWVCRIQAPMVQRAPCP